MPSKADLGRDVRRWVSRQNLPTFDTMVRLAEEDINNNLRVPEMQATASIGFSGNAGVLPGDFIEAVTIDIEGEDLGQEGLRLVPLDIFQRQPELEQTYGGPSIYSIGASRLYLAPAPGGDSTVTLTYYAKLRGLENDDDTNRVLDNYYDIYFNACVAHAYSWLRNQPEELKYAGKLQAAISRANTRAITAELGTGAGISSGFTRSIV